MKTFDPARRRFLQASAVAVSAAVAHPPGLGQEKERLPAANELIAGKDKRLVVHNGKVGEVETPLKLLREHPLTPKELMFVRNNQVPAGAMSLEPALSDGWKIEVAGLVSRQVTLSISELAKLPQEEVELVLQCSGNGRSRFSKFAKAEGAQWQHGAMANIKFKGVRLKTALDHLRIQPDLKAKYVTAEGSDAPVMEGSADFEHSLPLNDVLERSFLALALGGESIPKVHGGPVRLITPGYYATMNVKWLTRLRFEEQESSNHHHAGRYRTPLKPIPLGTKFATTLDNSEPNWNMRIKSVIFSPLDGEAISAGETVARGVAWNDGSAKIEAVEVSIDGGESWRRSELKAGPSPYAWHHWQVAIELPPGKRRVLSRAVDALGRCQPVDGSIFWNPAGYGWNGVDGVSVVVG